jgi:hypothetical protein
MIRSPSVAAAVADATAAAATSAIAGREYTADVPMADKQITGLYVPIAIAIDCH